MTLTIASMTEADLEGVLEVDLVSFPAHETAPASASGREDAAEVRARQLQGELARPFARLRVAREAGAVVGYTLVWSVVDEVQVLNLAVAPVSRRRGVGRALLADLLARAREGGAAKVLLEVRASNAAARALYASFGFSEANVRKAYYADGEDAVELIRSLVP